MIDRCSAAYAARLAAADALRQASWPEQVNNGEEGEYPYVANFGKGLPHRESGEVEPDAYRTLLSAIGTGDPADFDRIPLGTAKGRKLTNPLSGLAFDPEGPDAGSLTLPPAPRIDSPQNSAEMVELYWMSLCRDIPFTAFDDHPTIARATEDLSRLSDFRGPKQDSRVTPETIFRGVTRGDLRGPYVSQFLLRDIQLGTLRYHQTHDAVEAHRDYLTDWKSWLAVQRGKDVPLAPRDHNARRYLATPRDMAHYVHFDALYQAYLNACLILLDLGAPVDGGNPYLGSPNQAGFGTYGSPHLLSLVTEVATRALKVVWHQKWFVHRRMRPEEFGGRVHAHLSGSGDYSMINDEVFESDAVKAVNETFGSYLLPQAFPEGSPTHPAYGAGHATVAGACVTVLKAWFDESWVLPDPVVASPDGNRLRRYDGADHDRLTVGGELNKLAANIATARNMGGVHWRTDYSQSIRLGEAVAIGVLRDHKRATREAASFTLTRFDGTGILI